MIVRFLIVPTLQRGYAGLDALVSDFRIGVTHQRGDTQNRSPVCFPGMIIAGMGRTHPDCARGWKRAGHARDGVAFLANSLTTCMKDAGRRSGRPSPLAMGRLCRKDGQLHLGIVEQPVFRSLSRQPLAFGKLQLVPL